MHDGPGDNSNRSTLSADLPSGRSALAQGRRRLPPRLRQTLELRDFLVDTVDFVVSTLIAVGGNAAERTAVQE